MTRDVLTRSERRQQAIRHEQYKWERMSPEERDAAMMRAMNDALDRGQSLERRDLRMAGIPENDIVRRWAALLPLVIAARPDHLPVMGSAE